MSIASPLLQLFLQVTALSLVVLAFIVGLCLIFAPKWVFLLNNYSKRWISTHKMLRPLEIPIDMEEVFSRYSKTLGIILSMIGIGSFYLLWFRDSVAALVNIFSNGHNQVLTDLLMQSAYVFLILGSILAVIVGILLIVNTVLITKLSKLLNHWYSTRRAMKPLDLMRNNVDSFVESYARVSGIIITIFSLYTLVILFIYTFLPR
ncbi:MAG: hypothetical protein A3E84_04930 [Gammaproteobacteria bacterium RIFCSPHIGHO2_12_FULL_42_13]|nr:MAG: hypothetical protein A3E84_04930 [Gammaproteobacteria bacterium RIFCSPHIGHO2_12_FULL_42_13]